MSLFNLRNKNKYYSLLRKNVDIKKLRVLTWSDNSCYIDSVLFALFTFPCDFINKKILFNRINHSSSLSIPEENIRNILQKYIIKLVISIRHTHDINDCSKFRKILSFCKVGGMPDFGQTEQQEAGEFLLYLFTIFNINNLAKNRTITFVTNNLSKNVTKDELVQSSISYDRKASPIIFIDSFLLKNKINKNNQIFYFLKQFSDSGNLGKQNMVNHNGQSYKRRFSYVTYIDSPYIVFWAQRADPITNSKINTIITPTQKITLQKGRVLYLNSIILHNGVINTGHYIIYFKNNNKWYCYDDLKSNLVYIGNYFKMLDTTPCPKTNGVLYFYKE